MSEQKTSYKSKIGGQALIEGVMMNGVHKGAMACRLPNGCLLYTSPVPQLFPGYSENDSIPLSLTKWYELKDKKLSVKMCGYQSITNGYSFKMCIRDSCLAEL